MSGDGSYVVPRVGDVAPVVEVLEGVKEEGTGGLRRDNAMGHVLVEVAVEDTPDLGRPAVLHMDGEVALHGGGVGRPPPAEFLSAVGA